MRLLLPRAALSAGGLRVATPAARASRCSCSSRGGQRLGYGARRLSSEDAAARRSGSAKSVEQRYQKKTQLEHVLLRPDTVLHPPAATAGCTRGQRAPCVHSSLTAANRVVQYIGSTERISERLWVYDVGQGMVERDCEYVPGLYKIFDEILVNAADNKQRDARMDTIKVDIDMKSGTISVLNNGGAVPVQMHATEQVYVPELIFGHLLTGSN